MLFGLELVIHGDGLDIERCKEACDVGGENTDDCGRIDRVCTDCAPGRTVDSAHEVHQFESCSCERVESCIHANRLQLVGLAHDQVKGRGLVLRAQLRLEQGAALRRNLAHTVQKQLRLCELRVTFRKDVSEGVLVRLGAHEQ